MIQIVTLKSRPDLQAQVFAGPFQSAWPEFMQHDETANLYFAEPNFSAVLDTAFAVIDPADPGVAIGRAFAVPFAFGIKGREELPDSGWDGVLRWAQQDRALGRTPTAISALEITLLPHYRGQGASTLVLRQMSQHLRGLDYHELFVPVRPTAKHLEPFTPMAAYASRTRPDGLPTDPWLRVHVRSGGTIVKVAPTSMVVLGTVADWTKWTGMNFPSSGPQAIPGALAPVHISLDQDHGIYVEPNIWVCHAFGR